MREIHGMVRQSEILMANMERVYFFKLYFSNRTCLFNLLKVADQIGTQSITWCFLFYEEDIISNV